MRKPCRPKTPWRRASLLGLATLCACASLPEVQSRAPEATLSIDGAYDDWAGRFAAIGDGRSVALGIAHDRAALYLCLVTRDLGLVSLFERAGFTLWLDPLVGGTRTLGLRIAPEALVLGEASTPAVEIVFDGAEYGFQLVELEDGGPIDLRSAKHADVAVYELRLALGEALVDRGARPRQVTIARGSDLRIGIEGRMPDSIAGERDPGGNRRALRGDDLVAPLELWVHARLAPPTEAIDR